MSRKCIPGKTHIIWFTSRTTAGVPFALASGVVSAFNVAGTTTQFTTGISLEVSYDSVVGLNKITVDTTDATAYAFGEDIVLYLSAGTVNSVSVVGEVITEISTRFNDEGIVQSGIVTDAGSDDNDFVLPTGRRAGVTVGMVLAVEGIGARYIATYNSGTGVGMVTTAFASDISLGFFRVFIAAPADTSTPIPANVTKVAGVTIQGAGTAGDKWRPV